MKKARKLFCMGISVFSVMLLVACGNTTQAPNSTEDISETKTPSEGINAETNNSESYKNGEQQNRNHVNGDDMEGKA